MQRPPEKLLIASHNAGKLQEYGRYFSALPVKVLSATDVQVPEPEETGTTFEENALLKAKHAADHSQILALGDDGGLVIDALEGFPGLRSGRWAKEVGGFEAAFKELEERLKGRPSKASFQCVVSLYCPKSKESKSFQGRVDGHLSFPPEGERLFGYDPIFVPEGHTRPLAALGLEVKMKISHRAHCMTQVRSFLFG